MTLEIVGSNIYRGSQPTTTEDWQLCQSKSIAYCLDLQTGSDIIIDDGEPRQDKKTGLLYGIITYLFPLSEVFPPSKKKRMTAVNWIVAKSKLGQVLVHCLRGVDRTGAVIFTYRTEVCKWSRADALAEMKANGFHWFLNWWIPFL